MRIALIFVAALAVAAPAVASAQSTEQSTEQSMVVSLRGADYTQQDGARQTLALIDQAAKRFCTVQAWGLRLPSVDQDCKAEMVGKAVVQLNAPLVTALWTDKAGAKLALAQR